MKPSGLWLAVPSINRDAWWDWCADTRNYGGDRWRSQVTVDVSRLLVINNPDRLHALYGIETDTESEIGWDLISDVYSGIVVYPYTVRWGRTRPPPTWWNNWDCSSGCVWDLTAVVDTGGTEPVVFDPGAVLVQ